ncbi:MAG: hypothetical protein IPG94_05970 [Kineosporiaceae bacterium]|nr:hypothetical protein [Kineosporiaceae bacterium]
MIEQAQNACLGGAFVGFPNAALAGSCALLDQLGGSSMGAAASDPSAFELAVSWSNIISAVLAIAALVVALGVGTLRYQAWRLERLRWRIIGRALTGAGVGLTRDRFRKITREMLRRRLVRVAPPTLEELNWLGSLLGRREREASGMRGVGYHDFPEWLPKSVPLPITFDHLGEPERTRLLVAVARAYERYAAELRRRWLLRSAAGQLLTDEFRLAAGAHELLAAHARQERSPQRYDSAEFSEDSESWFACGGPNSETRFRLVTWPDMSIRGTSPTFAEVAVSYVPYRVILLGSPAARLDSTGYEVRSVARLPADDASDAADEQRSDNRGLKFDGVMSRLHGSGWRNELDPYSGRQRLHLCLSEVSYFAFRATQWGDPSLLDARGDDALAGRLLSVNLLLVDGDDKVVMVQRHKALAHGGAYAGAVSGACEVVARAGLKADLDRYGVPDPMRSIVREAAEELGLDISGPQWKLGALGLLQVDTPQDHGTYVLTAIARLSQSADEFALRPGSTDDVEGTWELGGEVMVVNLREALSTKASVSAFTNWLRNGEYLTPHGAGALAMLALIRLERSSFDAANAALPTPTDLRDGLRASVAASTPQPSFVSTHELWA